MNNKNKVALILKDVNELYEEYPGTTHGGGSVVNQNLYKELFLEQNIFIQYLLENIDDFIGKQFIQVILILIEMIGFLLIVIWKLLS